LWCEALLLAMADLQRDKYQAPTMKWIRSNEQYVGSFVWLCHTLDLNCEAVRARLKNKNGIPRYHGGRPKKNHSDNFQSTINGLMMKILGNSSGTV
jgi:hypothetical protein